MKLDRRIEELEEKNNEFLTIKKQFEAESNLVTKLKDEVGKLSKEVELKNEDVEIKTKELGELSEELKASKSAINWFKVELEEKQEKLDLRNKEAEEITKQLTEHQDLLNEKTRSIEQITTELQDSVEQLRLREDEINGYKTELEKHQQTIQDLQTELGNRKEDLNYRNTKLNSKEKQLQDLQTELQERIKEVEFKNNELIKQQETVNKLHKERDQFVFNFNKIKNSIPSSIIITDKNSNITDWNKKAEEILGLDPGSVKGSDLFKLDLIKKERILEKIKEFEKNKAPVTIKSISVKNKKGDIILTNISQTPLFDSNGEFQGAIMRLDDVSDTEGTQAELRRKQDDFEKLDRKFQDVYTKLKLVTQEKSAYDEHLSRLGDDKNREIGNLSGALKEKQRELESINNTIMNKSGELTNLNKALEENKSNLSFVESEISKKRQELGSFIEPKDVSKALKDKLRLIDEIDKSIGLPEEETLKTKKMLDDSEEGA